MRQHLLLTKQAVGLLFSLWFTTSINGIAQQSVNKADKQPYSLELTPKVHSASYSLYSGIYFNHHPTLEVNVSYKYKQAGAFLTKYVDLADVHSPMNYATVGFFRSFQLTESLKFTPYLGYAFTQANSIMDKGSDMWAGMVVRLAINERFWLENTTLAGNLLHHRSVISLANRLNAAIVIGKFRLDAYTWYTHSLHTAPHFVSASLAVTSPEWILSSSVSVKVQVLMLQQISDEKPEGAFDRGLVMSVIVPVGW